MENNNDIIKGEFKCPLCGSLLWEKRPKDKYIILNKELTVRLYCRCGYYRDDIVKPEDFNNKDNV